MVGVAVGAVHTFARQTSPLVQQSLAWVHQEEPVGIQVRHELTPWIPTPGFPSSIDAGVGALRQPTPEQQTPLQQLLGERVQPAPATQATVAVGGRITGSGVIMPPAV